MSVACADLNRDGYLDLVFCGFSNPELLMFYGDLPNGRSTPIRFASVWTFGTATCSRSRARCTWPT